MRRRALVLLLSVAALIFTVRTVTLHSADERGYTPLQKAFYLSAEDSAWIRPGLKLSVLDLSIPDTTHKPVVTFKVTDGRDQPLDRAGVITPGLVTTSFIIAYLPNDPGASQYVNYLTRQVKSPITNNTATQATTDSGGTYESRGDGVYAYTFGNALPVTYDRSATHTLGIYSTRDLREFGMSRYVVNVLTNFVPDGRAVTKVREVVATENCNQCHNPLALHGGSRTETGLCILCHTPQTTDPDTGNTVDFKVMVHKIHMGENLPSVIAGKPYQIIGFQQSVNDYSTVAFPQDIRNCATCHKNASQAGHYLTAPTQAACGSCHDSIDWNTGKNHAGGVQRDDQYCGNCHWPSSGYEYDSTVAGAHTVPYRSTQLRRPAFEIVSVANTGPGQKPTVQFRITDKDGKAIAPSAMSGVALRLAGPTSDYNWYLRESASGAAYAEGIATYQFTGALPDNATGTYSVGMEGYLNATLNPGTTKQFTYRDAGSNVQKFFAVTGELTPRRTVVALEKCNKCHDKLQLHGNNRNDPQYCVGCHNAVKTDGDRRPAAAGSAQGIHFKLMIHRIHTGEDLESDFTIYSGRANNFNEVRFPGDRRDCTTCHVGNSYTLPIASSALPTVNPQGFWSPMAPAAAACLGCHDGVDAAVHAFTNTATFGEACPVCHEEGAEFAVSKVHAR